MLDNEYLMQHDVRERLREARAIAEAAALARQARTASAPAGPSRCRSTRGPIIERYSEAAMTAHRTG